MDIWAGMYNTGSSSEKNERKNTKWAALHWNDDAFKGAIRICYVTNIDSSNSDSPLSKCQQSSFLAIGPFLAPQFQPLHSFLH
jgi:hypothetical protein